MYSSTSTPNPHDKSVKDSLPSMYHCPGTESEVNTYPGPHDNDGP